MNRFLSLRSIWMLLCLAGCLMTLGCQPDSRTAEAIRAQASGTQTPAPATPTATLPTRASTLTPPPTFTPSPDPSAAAPSLEITTTPTITMAPAVTNNFRAQQPMLGVALVELDEANGLEQGLDLGVTWMRRAEPLSWEAVEPTEGTYHWEALAKLEGELLNAKDRSVQPIIEIQFTPKWARVTTTHACSAIRTDKFAAFADFVEQVVTRYGPASPYGVRYWQLGNELDVAPNEVWATAPFGCWGDPTDPYYGGGHYADMLKVVYPRIKAADPEAQVLMGGLLLECDPATMTVPDTCRSQQRWQSGKFLKGILHAGGGDYFDIADVHSYAYFTPTLPAQMHSYYAWSGSTGGTGLPEKVTFVQGLLTQYGLTKPVFVGEAALKCYAPVNAGDPPLNACWEAAAAFVPRAYAEGYSLNVIGQVYYLLLTDVVKYSMLASDFSPRPMYTAYKFMSSYLENARFERAVTEYPGLSGSMLIQEGVRPFQIVWSTDGLTQTISIPAKFVRAFDKYGAPLEPMSDTLAIGWSPIYIELTP